ncbi:hypothetical protein [Streptomyces sp. NPDC057557]|uniref:hypothetical protein n=1 Tax=Streptomyces sp. NPDC057557 TaxID=3346167 RepID=UPI003680C8A9
MMREEINGRNERARFVVFAGLPGWPAEDVYVAASTFGNFPGPLTPAQARKLAAALRRAADEAQGVKPMPSNGRKEALGAVSFAYSGAEAEEYADDIVSAVHADVAAFIRANIDMQGLDFPDAESVAVWLEEGK